MVCQSYEGWWAVKCRMAFPSRCASEAREKQIVRTTMPASVVEQAECDAFSHIGTVWLSTSELRPCREANVKPSEI